MDRDDAKIRQRLEDERARLRGELEFLSAENQDQRDEAGVGNHIADTASDLFVSERNLAVSGNVQDLLTQVEQALQRLDQGTYGRCIRCGREINPERLEALPFTSHCITCQTEIERER